MVPRERNYARWMFFDNAARQLFIDWDVQARSVVETLRFEIGESPADSTLTELVADLHDHSHEFRRWWTEHRVYQRSFGSKRLQHPIVGELTVEFETFTMPADPGQTLFLYSTEPASTSRQALDLLASWHQPTRRASAR